MLPSVSILLLNSSFVNVSTCDTCGPAQKQKHSFLWLLYHFSVLSHSLGFWPIQATFDHYPIFFPQFLYFMHYYLNIMSPFQPAYFALISASSVHQVLNFTPMYCIVRMPQLFLCFPILYPWPLHLCVRVFCFAYVYIQPTAFTIFDQILCKSSLSLARI